MSKKMLIDAAHAEEVRVCVLENQKVEDFDFESSSRKPLRGNIYLARVTRVEPSLQAAFVEYGGNRHGFLAFNEIHPDYYQIPVDDRKILQDAEAEEAALAAELDEFQRSEDDTEDHDTESEDNHRVARAESNADDHNDEDFDQEPGPNDDADPLDSEAKTSVVPAADAQADSEQAEAGPAPDEGNADDKAPESETALFVSSVFPFVSKKPAIGAGNEDDDKTNNEEAEADPSDSEKTEATEEPSAKDEFRAQRAALLERYKEACRKRSRLIRNYKIQEVIKRRQILLIQVVKEERGNKGAALTTYMSLAGRYCVLMPNTARGGGISRKIPSVGDRKRLRRIVNDLDVGQGMGLIIRTAGAKRTKIEIKRDYDYLIRLWENVRQLTLKSIAPCLVYEEASLIKRAIRDLYDKDTSKIFVEGEDGYREAKDFMKMLMPSHAKNVQRYKEKTPLFVRHDAENQLDAMYQPVVKMKSGGYLVINQTEALIAIDVNSGKSTNERNIELTAVKTNLEAAVETARQCRLRDLAGLVVIDFIDMEENKNIRAVEKKLKEALKHDRARIQAGRISNFGLLEMSRQRRRSGIVDGTTTACPTCNGSGAVRSNELAALRILRAIEAEAIAGRAEVISAKASFGVSLFVLNSKREWLHRLENNYGVTIEVIADENKHGDQYEIEKRGNSRKRIDNNKAIRADMGDHVDGDDTTQIVSAETSDSEQKPASKKRRRRRKKRGPLEDDGSESSAQGTSQSDEMSSTTDATENQTSATEASVEKSDDEPKKRRRRGKRGGRRKSPQINETTGEASDTEQSPVSSTEANLNEQTPPAEAPVQSSIEPASEKPPIAEPAVIVSPDSNNHEASKSSDGGDTSSDEAAPSAAEIAERVKNKKPSRKGWWSRALSR